MAGFSESFDKLKKLVPPLSWLDCSARDPFQRLRRCHAFKLPGPCGLGRAGSSGLAFEASLHLRGWDRLCMNIPDSREQQGLPCGPGLRLTAVEARLLTAGLRDSKQAGGGKEQQHQGLS